MPTPPSAEDLSIPPAVLSAALTMLGRPAILVDPRGRAQLVNFAAARLLGRPPRLLIGTEATDLLRTSAAGRSEGWAQIPLPSAGPALGWSLFMSGESSTGPGPELPSAAHSTRPIEEHWDALAAFLSRVRPASTTTETSQLICEAVREATGLDGAMIILWPERSELVHVSNSGPQIPGFTSGSTFPLENLESIVAMTERGPWYLDLHDPGTRSLVDSDLVDSLLQSGLTATAYGGVRSGSDVIGVLAVASTAPDGARILAAQLPLIDRMAQLAGAVLGNQAKH